MKKLVTIIGLSLLTLSGFAQTNTTPSTIWDFLTTGSNYWFELAGTFNPDYNSTKVNPGQFGGEFNIGFKTTDFLQPVIAVEYFQTKLYGFSGTAQIQPPQYLLGKVPITPYARGGVEYAIGGLGQNNGQPLGVVGAGAYLNFKWVGSGWIWQHSSLDFRYDHHMGFDSSKSDAYVVGYRIDL